MNFIKNLSIILISSFLIIKCVSGREHSWLNDFETKMEENVKPHQFIIFSNSSQRVNIIYQNRIVEKLIKRVPSVNVDIVKCNNLTLQMLINNDPRTIATYVIIYDNMYSNETVVTLNFKYLIDFFITISPSQLRPKCLIIIIGNTLHSENFFEIILKYAWSKMFLDFTIIEWNIDYKMDSIINPFMYYFNPFANILIKRSFDSYNEVFPNKLTKVQRYPLNIPAAHHPPFIRAYRDANGKVVGVGSHHYALLETTALKLNFSIVFVDVSNVSFVEAIKLTDMNLQNGNIDITVIASPFLDIERTGELNTEFGCTPFVAIVPIIKVSNLSIPQALYRYLFVIPVIIISILHGAYFLKILKKRFNLFDVLQVLFGISIKSHPRKLSERMIFFSIIFLSMQYTTEFYSNFLDINLSDKEMSFNTIQEMINSPFDIYVSKFYYRRIFNSDQESIVKLKARTQTLGDTSECVQLIRGGKFSICITLENFSEYFVKQNKQIIKLVKPDIFCDRLSYTTKEAFPYAEKFTEIFRRIHASGILQAAIHQENVKLKENEETVDKSAEAHRKEIIIIVSSGYIISIVLFILEYIFSPSRVKSFKKTNKSIHIFESYIK